MIIWIIREQTEKKWGLAAYTKEAPLNYTDKKNSIQNI
jgi:hypothetical protein